MENDWVTASTIKKLPKCERYCFYCKKDRLSLVGKENKIKPGIIRYKKKCDSQCKTPHEFKAFLWSYNPIGQRSLCYQKKCWIANGEKKRD